MSEHKSDILSSTGSHRVWIGERAVQDISTVTTTPAPLASPVRSALPTRSWVRRPIVVPTTANPRHAAITKNLAHFTNYKSWTEKVKGGWKPDAETDKDKP